MISFHWRLLLIGHSNPPFPTLDPKRVMSAKMNVLKGSKVQILFMLIGQKGKIWLGSSFSVSKLTPKMFVISINQFLLNYEVLKVYSIFKKNFFLKSENIQFLNVCFIWKMHCRRCKNMSPMVF